MKRRSFCGKRYGITYYGMGFLIGFGAGMFAFKIIYSSLIISLALSTVAGMVFSNVFVNMQINRRKSEFVLEFCDYLDAISSSLSCGKNSYETFQLANDDMHNLYSNISPICIESQRVANGLKSGRSIDELLLDMYERTGCEDVKIFGDVYSICNMAGGDLKQTVSDTKNRIIEKINIENEIKTSLAAPKNELNIMALMPIVITGTLRILGDNFLSGSSLAASTIALGVFIFAYVLGQKIVKIEV